MFMVLSDYYDHFGQSSQYNFEFLKYFTFVFLELENSGRQRKLPNSRGAAGLVLRLMVLENKSHR